MLTFANLRLTLVSSSSWHCWHCWHTLLCCQLCPLLAGDRKRGACPSCQLPPAAGPSCHQLLQGGPLLLLPGPGIIPPMQHLVENIYTPSLLQSGRPGLWAGAVCDTRQNVMCLALSEQTHFWFYQPKIFLSVNHEGNK